MSNPNNHVIYLAGGCFWGVEEYFSRVPGVLDAVSGYANGSSETTRYELISQTGHAETVQVTYDAGKVTLREILLHFFRIINPLSKNKQGNDVGTQYRTGVYYTDVNDLPIIEKVSKKCLSNTVSLWRLSCCHFSTLFLLRNTIRTISRRILMAIAILMLIKPLTLLLIQVLITSQVRRNLK